MSDQKKQKSPATPCPVKVCALAGLVLLRAFLMPVIEVICGLCFFLPCHFDAPARNLHTFNSQTTDFFSYLVRNDKKDILWKKSIGLAENQVRRYGHAEPYANDKATIAFWAKLKKGYDQFTTRQQEIAIKVNAAGDMFFRSTLITKNALLLTGRFL